MSKIRLRRAVHRFNMAWRKLVPAKWRLRVTEDRGIFTLWNAEKRIYIACSATSVLETLGQIGNIWAANPPA